MSTPNTENWYAIFTRPRAEKKVYQRLNALGHTTYLPLYENLVQWSDRKKKVKTPLIPSYVFVKSDEQSIYNALNVPSAIGVLKHLGKLAIVKDQEIESLKSLLNSDYNAQLVESIDLSEGDEVEVVKGPLMGLNAFFVREKNKHRIIVKISALDKYIAVEIPLNFIEKRISVAV